MRLHSPTSSATLFTLCVLTAACELAPLGEGVEPVVYDVDHRQEVYQETNAARRGRAERSIVALIHKTALAREGNAYVVPASASTLDEYISSTNIHGEPLCSDQDYREQPAIASCSGTLIDDDLVLTAGHCVGTSAGSPSGGICRGYHFVFDYFYEAEGALAEIDEDDVYECDRIVAFRYDQGPPYLDLAIVKLTRPVVGDREPAPVDPTDDALAPGSSLTAMGFGSGLPMKIDSGGVVRGSHPSLTYFIGTTDTFAGNSGSGIFDASGNVVGILVSGEEDYVRREGAGCYEVNVLDPSMDPGVGEVITYVHRALDELCRDSDPSERLCESIVTPPRGKKGRCAVHAPGASGGEASALGVLTIFALVFARRARRRR